MATFTSPNLNTPETVLSVRPLIILGVSEAVSNIGNWITMMAVYAIVVFRGQGDVAQSSGIYLAGLLPTLLFSPAAGWLCDRFDRKKLMIISELISGSVIIGLVYTERIEMIYGLLALQAVSLAIIAPARSAIIPTLVKRERLVQANAFLQQVNSIVKIGAPLLAGMVLAVMNPHQAIILDVISFALSAIILTRLPSLAPPPQSISVDREDHVNSSPVEDEIRVEQRQAEKQESGREHLMVVLGRIPGLKILFLQAFLGIAVIVSFDILAPIYTRDTLQGGEGFFGLLIGLIGTGTLAVTLALMLRKGQGNPWRELLLGVLLLAFIPAALAVAAGLPDLLLRRGLGILACLVGGVGNGLLVVQIGTLLQLLTPAVLLGRVSGLFQSTMVAGQLIGILAIPVLVPGILSQARFFGLASFALFLTFLLTVFSLRNLSTRQGLAIASKQPNLD